MLQIKEGINIKQIKNEPNRKVIFFTLFVLFFVLSIPLIQKGLVPGHDFQYHLNRIENIAISILSENFPAKVHPAAVNGYGYGSGLFYPNLFLYFPALFRVFGCSLSISYKALIAAIIFLTVVSCYFSAKYIFRSKYTGLIAAILLTTSQTVISNLYIRAAVGEALGTIFIPIAVAALYNIIYENFSKPWLLILSFTGFFYTHTITLLLAGVIFSVLMISNINRVFIFKKYEIRHNIKVLLKFVYSAVAILFLSISYWLACFEQFLFFRFNVQECKFVHKMELFTLKLHEILSKSSPSPGIVLMVFSVTAFFLLLEKITKTKINELSAKTRFAVKLVIVGFILVILPLNIFNRMWKSLNGTLFSFIQFPWRLYVLAVCFLAIGTAGVISKVFKDNNFKNITFFVVCSLCILTGLTNVEEKSRYTVAVPEDVSSSNFFGGYEWLPAGTNVAKLLNSTTTTVYANNGKEITVNSKKGSTVCFEYNKDLYKNENNNVNYFDVSLLFYKGYSSHLISENGTKYVLKVGKSPNNNLVRVTLKNNTPNGKIYVTYTGTTLQHISYLINVIALLALLVFLCVHKFRIKNLA